MPGTSFLNEIVQRREVTQADQVLNELRNQIKADPMPLETGDTIYIISDGYTDQKKILDRTLSDWMGAIFFDLEQL